MKQIKKIMALVIAMVMVLGMSTMAMADTSIAVTKPTGAATTHTYEVYQIFTGTVEGTITNGSGKLTEVKYGSSHPSYSSAVDANNNVPKSVLDTLTDEAAVRTYIKGLTLGSSVGSVIEGGAALTVVPGYYYLKDVSYTADTVDDAFSAIIVEVVDGTVNIAPKRVKPTVDKEVKDEADDKDTASSNSDGWGETADHEIGETFQFRLTASLPADPDYNAYETYKVKFNDTFSNGVTFENIASVTVTSDGKTYPVSTYVLSSGETTTGATAAQINANHAFGFEITDLKALTVQGGTDKIDLTKGAEVVVVYNAHLNTQAAVNTASGSTTNKNTVTLTYSNNPDATGTGGTDTTTPDDVWVFTYGNNGTKEDAQGNKLPDAGFKLYAGSTTGTTEPTGTAISLYKVGNDYFKYDENKASEYTGGSVVTEMVTTADGIFNIKGLDIGTYTLYESTVPTGYVRATNTVFTIGATHTETSGAGQVTLTEESSTSETIVNLTGSTLPSTGGSGTTMLYIIGAILVLGAGILLVSKRRMSAN